MKRATIGLLTYGAGDPSNMSVWSGAADAARENGANLICFPGKPLRSIHGYEAQANIIYELVDAHAVDGLVIWLAGLTLQVKPEDIYSLCQRYHPLPIVTAGSLLKNYAGVVVDNYNGMKSVIGHLIEVHGYSRIAFIRGPDHHQEAEERYAAYRDALREHNLPLDHNIIAPGDFKDSGGFLAVDLLFDRRKIKIDALVAASDNMVVSAMRALQNRGIRVPEDIAIAGLNDEPPSKYISPPLTTASLHFYEQAYQATCMVLALLRGEEISHKVVIPATLMVRQSCGCLDVASPSVKDLFIEDALDTLYPVLQKEARGGGENEEGAFIKALSLAMDKDTHVCENISAWLMGLYNLFQYLNPSEGVLKKQPHAVLLYQHAVIMLEERVQRSYAFRSFEDERRYRTIGEINQRLLITTSIKELANELVKAMRLLHIPLFFLSLYENSQFPLERSFLILAYKDNEVLEMQPGESPFLSKHLVPQGFLPTERNYSLVIEPLYFRDEQLGFIVFEANPKDDEIYEILRGQISGALKSVILTERNIRLYQEAVEARQIAEEANRLKGLFLSMVSHELRSPLSLIVGTIDMMMQDDLSLNAQLLPDAIHQDIHCIRASAHHLSYLISDVLDLASSQAGELRLACETMDLASMIQETAVLGEALAKEKGLLWQANLPQPLPVVWGDRTRLRQVTLNLIINAVKFTERGKVELTVEVGKDEVSVKVTDTGMGIPLEEQETIFDEFRRSERSQHRGYGGMGLGLAISRRLIEMHHGKIGVSSSGEEEGGSTFFYSIPIMLGEKLKREQENRSQKVLLLSGNIIHFQKLSYYLNKQGYAVENQEIKPNGDWVTAIMENPPAAVVLDYHPALEKGWELMRTLKQHSHTKHIPLLFYSFIEERNGGSVLEMDLLSKPIHPSELLQTMKRFGVDEKSRGKKILIVDDELNILDLHARMLQQRIPSAVILKAKNGRQALEVMESYSPDLILLDLMMPEMDGFELLSVLHQKETTSSIPVVILTAQILSSQDMLRLQQGVAAVLSKGIFDLDEVFTHVEKALAHSKRLGGEAKRIVRQAMAYLHVHYSEPISRSELARFLGLSENYLTACFHEELGITPVVYLNRFRIKQAKILLTQGNTNITQIALKVGFSDSNYFGRVFRNEVKMSPLAYQQSNKTV